MPLFCCKKLAIEKMMIGHLLESNRTALRLDEYLKVIYIYIQGFLLFEQKLILGKLTVYVRFVKKVLLFVITFFCLYRST